MRKRDKHKSTIDSERAAKNAIKEKLSQDPDYKKKKKPNYADELICTRSETVKAKDDDDGDDDDDDAESEEKISTFNETINMKTKQSGVYFPLDVYENG